MCQTINLPKDDNNSDNSKRPILKSIEKEIMLWKTKFETTDYKNEMDFSEDVSEFSKFLSKFPDVLPGPKHPARKFYEARKRKGFQLTNEKFSTTNPQRKSLRKKVNRKAEYEYQITQFYYFNQRRKAVRRIYERNRENSSAIDIEAAYEHFSGVFESPNSKVKNEYSSRLSDAEIFEVNNNYNPLVTTNEIISAIKGISVDTAPGPDRIIMRSIKIHSEIPSIIATIATIMIEKNFVPNSFRLARTILIHKSGEKNNIANWRPITICSLLRRIIERALDKQLRKIIKININQRGFMNSPGCLINTSIIESILEKTKDTKSETTIIFLDIAKAYDSVGHNHLTNMLRSAEIPRKLQDILVNLQTSNKSYIDLGIKKSKNININSGVLQGAPLSPILFNFCINHIFEEISEKSIADCFGFPLPDASAQIAVLGFADDIALIGKDVESATKLLHMVEYRFREIGLNINPSKSSAIVIEHGKLRPYKFSLNYSDGFSSIEKDESIKYLGVNFSNILNFDHQTTMKKFSDKLEILTKTNLLNSDQKLNILNQYISPCLIYPFQSAPLRSLNCKFLTDINKIIRSSVKEIIQIPSDTPNGFLYSAKSVRGLQIFNCLWEAYLQQFNKFTLLIDSKCKHLLHNHPKYENCRRECLDKLNLASEFEKNPPKKN